MVNEIVTTSSSRPDSETNEQQPLNENDGSPELSYLWPSPPLRGKEQYLGGEVSSVNNKIYCIPGHAQRVLVIDPLQNTAYPIGPSFEGQFKWLRGISVTETGILYGLPCHADSVLRIDPTTDEVSTLRIPFEDEDERTLPWKYHGGSISPLDGCLYIIPQSAKRVLKLDPSTDRLSFEGPILDGKYKWYGGLVGSDQAIYGIPHNASSILRITPSQITLHGDFPLGGHKWHGAASTPDGSIIVSVPANADSVLLIHPGDPPSWKLIGDETVIQTGRHRSDAKYKYLGAVCGPDSMVYCMPSGSERVLQVDAFNEIVTPIGPSLRDANLERMVQNKWQNGFFSAMDGCVYGIPLNGESVLRIRPAAGEGRGASVSTIPLPDPAGPMSKWEGGVMSEDGVMYCMPLNHKAVLAIRPAKRFDESDDDDEQRPELQQSATDTPPSQSQEQPIYPVGMPTIRSSSHRVKGKGRNYTPPPRNAQGTTSMLPPVIRAETVLSYDTTRIDLKTAIIEILQQTDPTLIGQFAPSSEKEEPLRLEQFQIPLSTFHKPICQTAQRRLSDMLTDDKRFLTTFDTLVTEIVLPHLKSRLEKHDLIPSETLTAFYYQRPPTLRLQPGPSPSRVKPHRDSEYGHQPGELNFWLPLTDFELTGVELHVESDADGGDFHPFRLRYGQVGSFHGSSCRHFLPQNESHWTRVSLDFRVGVEGYFDGEWMMFGTSADHARRMVRL